MSKVILKMQNITKYIFDAYGKPIHGTDVKILKDVNFDSLAIVTSSGEVGVGGAGVYSALKVQTDSGDVSVSHKESPTDLQLDVTTDSNDITMQLSNIDFTKDTSGCKQGNIGQGNNKLEISSSSGTIIVK